ncbi:MAG: hypothetical protein ABMB14_09470 [Myxococcota bacterium]
MSVDRHLFARLKKLLLARDVDLIEQGVEFATSLDEPELWDALLTGVDYRAEHQEPDRWGRMVTKPPLWAPNALFTGTGPAQPFHDLALTLLVAVATTPTGAALRDRIEQLHLPTPVEHGTRVRLPRIPLDAFPRYPNLKSLSLTSDADLDLAPLGDAPALETLRVQGSCRISLAGLGRSRTLKHLDLGCALDSTAGIEGAPLDTVKLSSTTLRDLRGLGSTSVRTVELRSGVNVDASDLGRAPNLASLVVERNVSGLKLAGFGASPIKTLELRVDVAGLPTMPKLEALIARNLRQCAVQPAVTTVVLQAVTDVPPVASTFPAATGLSITHGRFDALAFLRGATALRALTLNDCTAGDASALGSLSGLETIALSRLTFPALDQLPPARLVDDKGADTHRLDLSNSPVKSVRGLAALKGLKLVDLSRCQSLETLDRLAGTGIEAIDLRGCVALTDVAALSAMPALRMAAVRGSARAVELASAMPQVASLAQAPDLEAARKRAVPSAPAAATGKPARKKKALVPAAQQAAWDGLQPLLAVTDPASLDRLMTYLGTHGTSEILDLLLAGVTLDQTGFTIRGRLLALDAALRPIAVQRIAALGLGSEAARVLAGTTRLSIQTRRRSGPADLRGISKFRALVRLDVVGTELIAVEELAGLPYLGAIQAVGVSLDALPALPGLVTLTSNGTTSRLDFVRQAAQLEGLSVYSSGLADLEGLRDHPRLARIDLRAFTANATVAALGTLRALTFAELGSCPPLPPMGALDALDTVVLQQPSWADCRCLEGMQARTLTLNPQALRSTAGLDRLPRLERLTLGQAVPAPTAFPARLKRLEVHGTFPLGALRGVAIDELVVRDPTDLTPVAELAGLTWLRIEQGYGKPPLDLAPLAGAATLQILELDPTAATTLAPLAGHPVAKISVRRWRSGMVTVPPELQARIEYT